MRTNIKFVKNIKELDKIYKDLSSIVMHCRNKHANISVSASIEFRPEVVFEDKRKNYRTVYTVR